MNITIRLTKVEYEMLKELQKRDKRYKAGIEFLIRNMINNDFSGCQMRTSGWQTS